MTTALEKLKKKRQDAIQELIGDGLLSPTKIYIGMSTCEIAAGSKKVWDVFEEEIKKNNIRDVKLKKKGCAGRCNLEPTVEVLQMGKVPFKYTNVDPSEARGIIQKHLVQNNVQSAPRTRDLSTDPFSLIDRSRFVFGDLDIFKKQQRITLRNCGIIDPESIEEYLSVRGYEALAKVLTDYTPEQVIDEITKSGLRGRGGGGFPTGLKWKFVAEANNDEKYVICNADEGDPGAFMDRSALEGDPHIVIEGMIIAGYAIGAKKGFIYIRAEYPLAIERLKKAINDAKENKLLGHNILNHEFEFDIELVLGAGAFVCGEETALIHSIEGGRGTPRTKPPYPSIEGLWGRPTLINNVETLANIAVIILDGYEKFNSIGTEKSKGTKVFALAGKVNNTGLIEVPMGITLREIIYDIGGGIKNGKKFKAVLTGGPSGGCIPEKYLDTPVDYDSLKELGSIMGSGGMIVLDEDDCMIDVARYFVEFTQNESCGKCTPCREGTKRMLEIMTKITSGKGEMEDIDKLERLANLVKKTALCGLGNSAPNPVLTTLKYFREEYISHVKYKKCPAVVCKGIISSPCQHACFIGGSGAPSYVALIAQERFEKAVELLYKENPLPIVCARVCHHPCESKCRRAAIDKSISIRALKRFLIDYSIENNIANRNIPSVQDRNKKEGRVAVIGSGPAGLTCAYYLSLNGYCVTVFEKLPVVGGMLAVAIPEYRLPKKMLEFEIKQLKTAGMDFKLNCDIGKDVSIEELKKGYNAIFIATGAHKGLKLGIPGEESAGVIDSVDLLRAINLGKDLNIGKKVAVIGGGNAAVDAARTLKRLGKEVYILYRRTRNEMPAWQEEIDEALKEGVEVKYLTAPLKVISQNKKVKRLRCVKMKLGEVDKSGRRKPVPVEGSEFEIDIDTLVPAISQKPELKGIVSDNNLKISKWDTVEVNEETLYTGYDGIFAGGDVVLGPSTVTDAISQGKIAADMINKYIRGEKLKRDYKVTRPAMEVELVEMKEEEIESLERFDIPLIDVSERTNNFREVESGFTKYQAVCEAKHCLRCDREERE
jgi:NADH-quinone oxidoreductase subunit F